MRRLAYLAAARQDLATILAYVTRESGSLAVGRTFVETLRARCRKLAQLPATLGRARPELMPGLRSMAHGNYIILFRYVDDRLEVVNIIEGHRDIATHVVDDHNP